MKSSSNTPDKVLTSKSIELNRLEVAAAMVKLSNDDQSPGFVFIRTGVQTEKSN